MDNAKVLLTSEEWERLKMREKIRENVEKRRQQDKLRRMIAQKLFGLFLLVFTVVTCVNTQEGFAVAMILVPMGLTYIFSRKQLIFKRPR